MLVSQAQYSRIIRRKSLIQNNQRVRHTHQNGLTVNVFPENRDNLHGGNIKNAYSLSERNQRDPRTLSLENAKFVRVDSFWDVGFSWI